MINFYKKKIPLLIIVLLHYKIRKLGCHQNIIRHIAFFFVCVCVVAFSINFL